VNRLKTYVPMLILVVWMTWVTGNKFHIERIPMNADVVVLLGIYLLLSFSIWIIVSEILYLTYESMEYKN